MGVRGLMLVQNVVGNLKYQPQTLRISRDPIEILARAAADQSANAGCGDNQGTGLEPIELFQNLWSHLASFQFEFPALSANHSSHPSRCGYFADELRTQRGSQKARQRRIRDDKKRFRQQCIPGEKRYRLTKTLMAGSFTPAEIIIVERGQVVMYQRITVNQLDSTSEGQKGCTSCAKQFAHR